MVDTQKVRSTWLCKEFFSQEDWVRLLDLFDVDEDIRDRTFAIDVWDAQVAAVVQLRNDGGKNDAPN